MTIDAVGQTPSVPDLAAPSDWGASDSDNLTAVTTPTFTGTSEAGATVTLLEGAKVLGIGKADGTGAWSIKSSLLSEGVHAISGRLVDLAGNTSAISGALSVTIDNTPLAAPGAPILIAASDSGISSTDNITKITTPSFTGKALANTTVVVLDAATTVGSAVSDGTGAWSITTSALKSGSHSIAAAMVDIAGNMSTPSTALTVVIDTVSTTPSTADLLATSDSGSSSTDNITNVQPQTFTGTAEAAATVLLLDGVTQVGSVKTNASGAWSIKTSALTEGVHAIIAQATDIAGNVSVVSRALPVTIDITTPAVPTTPDLAAASDSGASNTDNLTNLAILTITGKAEIDATVTLLDDGSPVGTAKSNVSGVWSINTTALSGGGHGLRAMATDIAGNVSDPSTTLSVTVDLESAKPSLPNLVEASDTGASNNDNITNFAAAIYVGTAEANAAVVLLDGATQIGTAKANNVGAWSILSSKLTEGMHLISTKATDLAGNVSVLSDALTVTIDTTGPAKPSAPNLDAASDTGESNTDNLTSVATPNFTGIAEANVTVELRDGAAVIGSTKANGTGAWSITAGPLTEGTHLINATAIDLAGNVSAISDSLSLSIITTGPVPPGTPDLIAAFDSGVSDTDNITKFMTPTFAGKAPANLTVILYDGAAAVGITRATGDGSWSITPTTLASGKHQITVKAVDSLGNPSTASSALAVTIDSAITTPTVPDLAAASDSGVSSTDNITNVTLPGFTGTAEANTTVKLFDGATTIGTGAVDKTGAWSVKTTTLAAGVHTITAQATDVAGNVSAMTASLSVTIDVTAPNVPSVPNMQPTSDSGVSMDDDITKIMTPSFIGTAEANATVTLYDGDTTIGSAKASSMGNWTIKVTALVEGPHSIAARATDAAGNTSIASIGLPIVIDTAPPDSSAITEVKLESIAGTSEAGSLVKVLDGGVVLGTAATKANGSWKLTKTITSGSHVFTVTAMDVAGNTGASSKSTPVAAGSAGTDVLFGAAGPDLMIGGSGNDIYFVNDSGDAVMETGGQGIDTILASVGYALPGGSSIEFLTAFAGTKGLVLTGNELANTITGDPGDDIIAGGGGADVLTGGGGANTFVLKALADSTFSVSGRDRITDFPPLAGDKINLSLLDADTGLAGDQAFTFIGTAGFSGVAGQLRLSALSSDTRISGDVNGDKVPDFGILLTGPYTVGASNFTL